MQDKIIINDYIENDPLSEENLDKTLETVDRFRLSFQQKTIWLYSGYEFDYLFGDTRLWNMLEEKQNKKRQQIISQCDILVEGRYIDSQRDIALKWRGSSNQKIWKNNNGLWTDITYKI